MPNIKLPKVITGKNIVDILQKVSSEIDFKYAITDKGIILWKVYDDNEVSFTWHSIGCSLELNFGVIEYNKKYNTLTCNPSLGEWTNIPIEISKSGDDVKKDYDRFVTAFLSYIK